ncbi:MAG: sodium:calcium antiporter [Kiritimatiellia bacterium]
MLFNAIMLLVSLGLILLASYVFTNGIELLGSRLNLHQGATGSILAAVGTALPETIIPVIAIIVYHADPNSVQVGIGAIAGAPFMLATLGFFVTGAAVLTYAALGKRKLTMQTDTRVIGRDLSFFLFLYGAAVLVTFAHDLVCFRPLKLLVALTLLIAYIWYVRRTILADGEQHEDLEPLHLARLFRTGDHTPLILAQVAAALALMVWGADMFVRYVGSLSTAAGLSPLILSMIITPIATELPEKLNSVIWTGQRKDTMALGNITGAMVFQSSFPVVFGLLFTPWELHGAPLVSAAVALAGGGVVLAWIRCKRTMNPYVLLLGGPLYAVFVVYICFHK